MAMFQEWSVCFPWLIIELGWSPKNFCHDIEAERSMTVEELEPWFANVIVIKFLHVDLAGYLLASFFFFFLAFYLSLMAVAEDFDWPQNVCAGVWDVCNK